MNIVSALKRKKIETYCQPGDENRIKLATRYLSHISLNDLKPNNNITQFLTFLPFFFFGFFFIFLICVFHFFFFCLLRSFAERVALKTCFSFHLFPHPALPRLKVWHVHFHIISFVYIFMIFIDMLVSNTESFMYFDSFFFH